MGNTVEFNEYPTTLEKIMAEFDLSIDEINALNGTNYTEDQITRPILAGAPSLLLPDSKVQVVYEYDDFGDVVGIKGYEPTTEIEPPVEEIAPQEARVELKAVPALFLAESETDVMEQYWYTQQVGHNLEVTGAMSSFQEMYEYNQLQNVEQYNSVKAQQLFINKQLFPVLDSLISEYSLMDMFGEVDLDAYPHLTQEIYDDFVAGRYDGMPHISQNSEAKANQEAHIRAFIEQLRQERGWTGMMMTIADMTRLGQDRLDADLGLRDVNIYTDPALMSPYTVIQEWAQAFDYGTALGNGELPSFLPYIPTGEELTEQLNRGISSGLNIIDTSDPIEWWNAARSFYASWIEMQNPTFTLEGYERLAEGFDVELWGSHSEVNRRLAEEFLIADLGYLDDLTIEEIAQYISTFREDHPEMAEIFDSDFNDHLWGTIDNANTYLEGIETIEQVGILTLDEDEEWKSLLSEIQGLPESIFGVSLSGVKSAFSNISQGSVEPSETSMGVIDMDIAYAHVIREEQETRQALIDMAFLVASFASGAASYQIGLAFLELLVTGNPTGLAAELLPPGLDNLGSMFRGADEVVDMARYSDNAGDFAYSAQYGPVPDIFNTGITGAVDPRIFGFSEDQILGFENAYLPQQFGPLTAQQKEFIEEYSQQLLNLTKHDPRFRGLELSITLDSHGKIIAASVGESNVAVNMYNPANSHTIHTHPPQNFQSWLSDPINRSVPVITFSPQDIGNQISHNTASASVVTEAYGDTILYTISRNGNLPFYGFRWQESTDVNIWSNLTQRDPDRTANLFAQMIQRGDTPAEVSGVYSRYLYQFAANQQLSKIRRGLEINLNQPDEELNKIIGLIQNAGNHQALTDLAKHFGFNFDTSVIGR